MKSFEEIYKEWRWSIYNEVEHSYIISFLDKSNFEINSYIRDLKNNPSFKNYTPEIFEQYLAKKFEVSQEKIELYDRKLNEKFEDSFSKGVRSFSRDVRSIFIENCVIVESEYDMGGLIEKIKKNLIYYHWWDVFSFEQLIQSLIDFHFLRSTKNLIDNELLLNHFASTFESKEHLISHIFQNFSPSEFSIEEMNSNFRGRVMFDYDWLFGKELIKSIRIFENECRFHFKEKVIGAFYNENLLFRIIKENFGDEFNIVSQGSPEWLKPQRYDIYFSDLNIAIEYQGEQHFRPVDFGGKGHKFAKSQFQENLNRDKIKMEKSNINNCTLIYVTAGYEIKKVLNDIKIAIDKKRN